MDRERTAVGARAALAVLASVVLVWLGVGLAAARPQAQGRELTRGPLETRERFEEALELFRRAQRRNPDSDPMLLEGGLLIVGGRPREGARVLERVVREEPENSKAWALLVAATRRFDPGREAEARRELRRLKPPLER